MPTIRIPGPCPYCGGKKFARFTDLNFSLVLMTKSDILTRNVLRAATGGLSRLFDTEHYSAAIMCETCGHTALFSQNPQYMMEKVGDGKPLEIEVKDDAQAPYR